MAMRIVVCVKYVLDVGLSGVNLGIDSDANALRDEQPFVVCINPYDAVALESAVRIRERHPAEVEVTAVTVSDRTDRELPAWCLLCGADRVVSVTDEGLADADWYTTSVVLAQVIRDLESDLVLCGRKAVDREEGQVPIALAELLGLPHVTGIVGLEVDDEGKRAVVHRRLEKGAREIVECLLPAVFSVDVHLNDPRYPSLVARRAAMRAPRSETDLCGLGLAGGDSDTLRPLTRRVSLTSPRPRTKKTFTPDSNLSLKDRMKAISSGGLQAKASQFLEGPPEKVANELIAYLVEEKLA